MIFPELGRLMAMKNMNKKDIASVMGCSPQAAGLKLNGKSDIKRREMQRVKEYFKDVDPDITMDKIFEEYIFLSR